MRRRLFAGVTATLLTLSALLCAPAHRGVAAGIDEPIMMTVMIDGRAAPEVPTFGPDDQRMVGIEGVGRDMGLAVSRTGDVLTIVDGETTHVLRSGSDAISSAAGDVVAHLSSSVVASTSGTLFMAVDDLPHVFNAVASITDGTFVIVALSQRTTQRSDAADSAADFEQHDRAVVRPTPPPSAASQAGQQGSDADRPREIGTVQATVDQMGGTSRRSLIAIVPTGTIRGTAQLTKQETTTYAGGTLEVGSRDRFVAVGQRSDPLGGPILAQTWTNGVSLIDKRDGFAFHSVANQFGTHSYVLARKRGNARTEAIYVKTTDGRDQIMLAERRTTPIGETEALVSTRGFGFGMTQQTEGRLFVRATESYASPGLPLTDGSAPFRGAIGWHASNALTLLGGYGSAFRGRPAAFIGGTLRAGEASGSLSLTSGSLSGIVTLAKPTFQAMISATSPRGADGATFYNLHATTTRPNTPSLRIEGSFASNSTQRDFSVSAGPAPGRAGLVAGIEYVRDSFVRRIGPLIGVSAPLGSSGLRVELAAHPTTTGSAVRFGLTQSIMMRPRSWGTTVHLSGDDDAELYVDQRAPIRVHGGVASLRLSRGSHTLWARVPGGRLASEQYIVQHTDRNVDVKLFPLATVAGRVTYEGPREIAPPSLSGMIIKLLPSGQTTMTSGDGSFAFPPQPIAAGTMVALDATSLPSGTELTGSGVAAAAGTDAVIALRSTRRVESARF